MADKGLLEYLLHCENFHNKEETILTFIQKREYKNLFDVKFLEALDVAVSYTLETDAPKSRKIFQNILTNVCFPILRAPRLGVYEQNKMEQLQIFQLNYVLITKIMFDSTGCTTSHTDQVWSMLLHSLQYYSDDCHHVAEEKERKEDIIDITTALDLLGCILEAINSCVYSENRCNILPSDLEDQLFGTILQTLRQTKNSNILYKITGKILPKLLLVGEKGDNKSQAVWQTVKDIFAQEETDCQSQMFFASFAILSSLADIYLSIDKGFTICNVHHDPQFWTILQDGLVKTDTLVRKQSLYILRKTVQLCKDKTEVVFIDNIFWWSPEVNETLFETWQQLGFLLEILEEKQLHVIQPVLVKLEGLVRAAMKIADCMPLLPMSWLTVVIHRAAIHENRFINKWGVMSLMNLDLRQVPLMNDARTRHFISDTLIKLLKDATLYAKASGEEKAEPSTLSKKLTLFYKKCFDVLHDEYKVEFLNAIFLAIARENLSHVPLVFICQSLANIDSQAIYDEQLLTNIKLVLSVTIGHSVVLRGAVQTFLLRVFMKLVKPNTVALQEVLIFFGLFPREESLCRGTVIWNEITEWFRNYFSCLKIKSKDVFSFLKGEIDSFLKQEMLNSSSETAVRLAKMTLLCNDSSALSKDQMTEILNTIFFTMSKALSNPYQPLTSYWQAVQLLRALIHALQASVSDNVSDDIILSILNHLHDNLLGLLKCNYRNGDEGNEANRFHSYRVCFDLLRELKLFWRKHSLSNKIIHRYQALVKKAASDGLGLFCKYTKSKPETIKDNLDLAIAVKWILWVIGFADFAKTVLGTEFQQRFCQYVRSWRFMVDYQYPVNSGKSELGLKQEDWRLLAEDLISAQWTCVNVVLQSKWGALCDNSPIGTTNRNSMRDFVYYCTEALGVVSGEALLPPLKTLQLSLPELIATGEEELAVNSLNTVTRVLKETRGRYCGYFWPVFDIVVQTMFSKEILLLPTDHTLSRLVTDFWKSLLIQAHDQTGLISVSIQYICKCLYVNCKEQVDVLHNHVDIIADICMFGAVHRKDSKLLHNTAAYIQHSDACCGTIHATVMREFECEFSLVRVDIVMFLLSLVKLHINYRDFYANLITILLDRSNSLSKAKASRFLNSENHRQKQRLWQIILVSIHHVNDGHFLEDFINRVFQALQCDNQTSVRFLMEWTLVIVFVKHEDYLPLIITELSQIGKKRLGFVASLISITIHIALALKGLDSQREYIFRVLPLLIPCAFLNHSQIRAYILKSLKLIEEDENLRTLWGEIIQKFPIVETCLAFSGSVVEGEKEKARLEKDRQLFSIHPLKDFNIETIFDTAPRIAGLIPDEIITVSEFLSEGSIPWVEIEGLPLHGNGFCKHKSIEISQQSPCETSQMNSANNGGIDKDFQKKITPWQVVAPQNENKDMFDQLQQRSLRRNVGNLVVVASLIDRAPNLGGLCRTCEIFGASRLVVGSKHMLSDIGFKSVSVTSEKWVDIEEVKVNDLFRYLNSMKNQGFTIVGVEQTAHSKKLTDFQFPVNTVLLLGNEKAGVPVELIQLLDECVEIQQQGIIRSLNVHVSGALFIWEYSRQHLNNN